MHELLKGIDQKASLVGDTSWYLMKKKILLFNTFKINISSNIMFYTYKADFSPVRSTSSNDHLKQPVSHLGSHKFRAKSELSKGFEKNSRIG